MPTQFYVSVGQDADKYAKEIEHSFEALAFRQDDQISLQFNFEGSRHHVGTLRTTPEIARWIAYALLSATEGPAGSRVNRICVRDGAITERQPA
ncbi:MAG: hypothetical protein P4L99_29300 [Chthoniobacter sp.]|nr:hypothetical protein [Chthoniobacter sp.]